MFTIYVVNYTTDEEIFITKVVIFWKLSMAVRFYIAIPVPPGLQKDVAGAGQV